ncbi:MAG TPA: YceI family protein [Rhodanobacteraceae bacterium]|nr:YceI family protein [Rhodanobacteraceae bacterium]
MIKAALALALLLPCLAPLAAPAAGTQTWPLDPAHSQTQFSVRKFWFAHARGTFPELQGTLRRIDTASGNDLAQVTASIDVAGLLMDDHAARETTLGPRFFDAARFPLARFDSDPFPLAELASGGTVRGMLLLHGEQHPVTFSLQASECPKQPLLCVIRVSGSLSRSDFGMHAWRGLVGDKVELSMRIVLLPCLACDHP